MSQVALGWSMAPTKLRWLDWLAGFLLLGYFCMTRSFAYLGVAPLYIGEIGLAAFLLCHPQPAIRQWIGTQYRPSPISGFSWLYYLFLGYGVISIVRGVSAGHDLMVTVQCAVVHVYPLYFFVGWWVGGRHSRFLPKAIYWMAWLNGLYGLVYIPLLLHSKEIMTGMEVGWFGDPRGASVAILGLLCFGREFKRAWIPLIINFVVLVGMQSRSAWIALFLCIPLWGLLAGRLPGVLKVSTAAFATLLLFLMVDAPLPIRNDQGERLTTRNVVGFAIAAVDKEAASGMTRHAASDNSTVTWRTRWWDTLWHTSHETPTRALFGPGYGYPIWNYHEEKLDDVKLRTPHNAFYFALVYTGWTGVILFFGLQLGLAAVLWRVYRHTGQAFGFCFWVLMMVRSCFTPFFETPYGAIPFFLICGLAAAPLMHASLSNEPKQVTR